MRVDLHKKPGVNLGLTVSGGSDRGEPPLIANIRPGSIADRSDSLLLNDHILAVNGVWTDNLSHDEIVRLAKHSGPKIHLDIEYDLPDHRELCNSHLNRTR
ncbi:hypothetical protein Ciccas_004835 [Cichlidogyrus casuarinus]|uniref:PDZ domain-containing protein n=1 Tax=Cichlidogyrus casuarinus TaxID=1844966 RepID=A0ABD2QAK2_9PLAT